MSCMFTATNIDATNILAEKLAVFLKPGDVIALEGDLGAGKTTFTQFLANSLGIKDYVDSPTFSIIKEYNGKYPFYHMDVYRIAEEEAIDIGLEEYLYGQGICVVEWASKISGILPDCTIHVDITSEGDKRDFNLRSKGKDLSVVCRELSKC